MRKLAQAGAVMFALLTALVPASAFAQIPPHAPGSICATPKFWCRAVYPGPPGTRCACPSQSGWVQGVLV